MKLLQRYIIWTIIKTILLVFLVVLGLEIVILFLSQLHKIGHGGYGVLQAAVFVLYSLPQQSYSLFPAVALLGTVIGLGSLASNSELVVMRAAGVSVRNIVWAVLKAALLIIIIMTCIGELLGPIASQQGAIYRANAENGTQTIRAGHGVWVREANKFIHVQQVLTDTRLRGIMTYFFNDQHRLVKASYAKQADYTHKKWQLLGVRESIFRHHQVSTKQIATMLWSVDLAPKLFSLSIAAPDQLSLPALLNYIHYRKHNGLQANQYALSFWQRILQPLATIIMTLLAIPFIFGPLRSVTLGVRIMAAVAVGFGFYLLNKFFGPMTSVYHMTPWLSAALPSFLFAIIALWLLRRVR